jgi:hypothetical protein
MFFFWWLIFSSSLLAINDQRTAVFLEHGSSNQDNYYFVPETFQAGKQERSSYLCNLDEGKKSFWDLINDQIACIGTHCQPGITPPWACLASDNQECYHATYIFPINHGLFELRGCSVNIIGNLVMSYGQWDQQLSNSHYDEKLLIYGDLFKQAYQTIQWCCQTNQSKTLPSSNFRFVSDLICPWLMIGVVIMVIIAEMRKWFLRLDKE